jgi:hypothetical protein
MIKNIYTILIFIGVSFTSLYGGNPDRQGESGAGELLFNPWARSAGLHSINTSSVMGLEAMRLNVAGLGRINKWEVVLSSSQVFRGSELTQVAGGFATKIGKNGTLGGTLTSLSFGDIPITTVNQPEGTNGTFSPNFTNLALGYSYLYENKISVGLLTRFISENLPDLNALGFSIDAGVQYVSGEKENFRLGISLLNIGSPMKFSGQGLAFQGDNLDPTVGGNKYPLTFYQRAEGFNLPTQLNIGLSYDWYMMSGNSFVRTIGNFTSNAYTRDELGAGLEFNYKNLFMVRGAYRYVVEEANSVFGKDVYTGISAGASINIQAKKGKDSGFGVDYAYRATNPFGGSHNVSLRMAL